MLLKDAAAVIGQHQRDRVEHMDGRADIDGCVGAVQEPHRTGEDVCARHIAGAQIQPGGQDHVAGQRNGHTAEQRHTQPPEVLPGCLPQKEEQGERDPRKPCKIGDGRIFAEGNQIVQPAVHEDVRHMDLGVQEIECGKIKYEIQRHEANRMARKPTAFH